MYSSKNMVQQVKDAEQVVEVDMNKQQAEAEKPVELSLIHISEPTRHAALA